MSPALALSKTFFYLLYLLPILISAPYAGAAPHLGRGASAIKVTRSVEAYNEIRKVLIDGHSRHQKRDDGFCWAL